MKISGQVYDFVKRLHPAQRRAIKAALRKLAAGERSEVRALINELEGFYRLRLGNFRIIFRETRGGEIFCEFIEKRDAVYKEFTALRRIIEGRRK